MDAACNLVIDSKVEERMGALQASLHQKIEREVQELTDAVRDSLHGELSAWKEATFKQMEDSLTSFLKESKEVKEQQTDLSRGIAEVKTQVRILPGRFSSSYRPTILLHTASLTYSFRSAKFSTKARPAQVKLQRQHSTKQGRSRRTLIYSKTAWRACKSITGGCLHAQ